MNRLFLHLEGAFFFLLSIVWYASYDFSWLVFFILLFVPDISMIGYAINQKTGALLYNVFHTYTIPIIIILLWFLFSNDVLLTVSLIWLSHIGMDRMLGYGLKYPTHFKDTHLNRV
ncbi:hypothetical protein HNQ94_000967 [Salirhabdus euzebyi]|uniref:DUF4260 domain-containing protein n=1 Tax=Salirhabdus euzebyi TaxID=394506 RepID=A0A841Q267_9BACI|nr:DUF4260 domain-containing protein [Salirhabdus euzebyi]MBB6452522.1 hypothetical protein [Salirhabdus euzebyi]